jgi:hypothetical protein
VSESPFPIRFQWDGEAMVPATRYWAKCADKRYVVGETYTMDEIYARSKASHDHFFAVVDKAWETLNDRQAAQYPNAEKLRRVALIRTGFRDEKQYVCESEDEAMRLAVALKDTITPYQIIDISGPVVTLFTAKSQDHRHMDKQEFQASKEAVLRWIGDLIGVDPTTLSQQSEAA